MDTKGQETLPLTDDGTNQSTRECIMVTPKYVCNYAIVEKNQPLYRCNNIIDADKCSIRLCCYCRARMTQMVDMWQMRQYACGHPRPAISAAVMPPGHAVGTTYAMELLKATVLLAPPVPSTGSAASYSRAHEQHTRARAPRRHGESPPA